MTKKHLSLENEEKTLLKDVDKVDFKSLPIHSYYWSFEKDNKIDLDSSYIFPSTVHGTRLYVPNTSYKPISCFFKLNKICHERKK